MATETQRHRAERERGFPDNLFFSFPLCLCVSVSLWQNKRLNVACHDLADQSKGYVRANVNGSDGKVAWTQPVMIGKA
jgi:hypothetical protein